MKSMKCVSISDIKEIFNKTFVFKSKGRVDSIGVLKEYIDSIEFLHISEFDRIKYLKAIGIYLQEDLDNS